MCFERREEAERFMRELKIRLAKFKLEIAENKSMIIRFDRSAWHDSHRGRDKPDIFDFLGFTHGRVCC